MANLTAEEIERIQALTQAKGLIDTALLYTIAGEGKVSAIIGAAMAALRKAGGS